MKPLYLGSPRPTTDKIRTFFKVPSPTWLCGFGNSIYATFHQPAAWLVSCLPLKETDLNDLQVSCYRQTNASFPATEPNPLGYIYQLFLHPNLRILDTTLPLPAQITSALVQLYGLGDFLRNNSFFDLVRMLGEMSGPASDINPFEFLSYHGRYDCIVVEESHLAPEAQRLEMLGLGQESFASPFKSMLIFNRASVYRLHEVAVFDGHRSIIQ